MIHMGLNEKKSFTRIWLELPTFTRNWRASITLENMSYGTAIGPPLGVLAMHAREQRCNLLCALFPCADNELIALLAAYYIVNFPYSLVSSFTKLLWRANQ